MKCVFDICMTENEEKKFLTKTLCWDRFFVRISGNLILAVCNRKSVSNCEENERNAKDTSN